MMTFIANWNKQVYNVESFPLAFYISQLAWWASLLIELSRLSIKITNISSYIDNGEYSLKDICSVIANTKSLIVHGMLATVQLPLALNSFVTPYRCASVTVLHLCSYCMPFASWSVAMVMMPTHTMMDSVWRCLTNMNHHIEDLSSILWPKWLGILIYARI